MTDKSLPERMREAADTLSDAAKRLGYHENDLAFYPRRAREYADEFERQDAEEAAQQADTDAQVEELGRALWQVMYPPDVKWDDYQQHEHWLNHARTLIAAGWRKASS